MNVTFFCIFVFDIGRGLSSCLQLNRQHILYIVIITCNIVTCNISLHTKYIVECVLNMSIARNVGPCIVVTKLHL